MQASKIVLRITKILGKAMLGLLILLLIAVALIHLPPIQQQLTERLSKYLSAKIETRVEIESINFSLLGNVSIDDLGIWDPTNTKIFSAHKVEVSSSIYNLIQGDFIFDRVQIDGVDFKLIQNKEGLNIQFILDAFEPKEKPTTTASNPILLQFKEVLLENVTFEYTSSVSGVSVDVKLGMFEGHQAEFSTNPLTIKANQAILENSIVNTLSATYPDTLITVAPTNNYLLSPDFGTGIVLDFKDLRLLNDDFSYHRDQVTTTRKFDPDHIGLNKIQLMLTDFLMNEDTLAAGIQSLSTQLPGFSLKEAKADIRLSRNQMVLSKLHLAAGSSEIHADLSAPNNLNPEIDTHHIEIHTQSLIDPKDFGYFLSDSMMNPFHHWGITELKADATYYQGKGKITTMSLKTGNSQFHASGMMNEVFNLNKISWQAMTVNASIGSDFKRILAPLLQTINLPPAVTLQLKSSGNLKKIAADVNVFSTWGDVTAHGQAIHQANNTDIDITLAGEKVDLGQWLNLSWIGPMDLTADAKGIIGDQQHVEINGLINNIEMMDQRIHQIAFQSTTGKDSAMVTVSIEDMNFRSAISSEILFAGPLIFNNTIELDGFKLGRLLHRDSTLSISGDTKSKIIIDSTSLEGYLMGNRMTFHKQSVQYSIDTMEAHALISPTKSDFKYLTDKAKFNLSSNFDIRDISSLLEAWSIYTLKSDDKNIHPTGSRVVNFNIDLDNASFLQLLGINVEDFSSLRVIGKVDEQKQTAALQASSGKFRGYGISLDTLQTNLVALHDSISATMNIEQLFYNSISLGNLDFNILTQGDTAISNLLLTNDSITLLGLQTRILPTDSGAFVYPDKLIAFNNDYYLDPKNPVYIGKNNLMFNHFQVSRDDMQLNLDGDLSDFEVSLKNIDLTPLNLLLSPDTTIINKGHLTGIISYSSDQQINLKADIDSLMLYNSTPLTITATAVSDGTQVPFEFLLTNTSNKIDLNGQYSSQNQEVEAKLALDVNNLELFAFLVSGFIEEMDGSLSGEATISGPIQKPVMEGNLKFLDVGLTTVKPRLTFNIEEEMIKLDNSSLWLNDFTLYDKDHHPLTINGNLTLDDAQTYTYDFLINSDNYALINNPDSTRGMLRGMLVVDSDIKLKGNKKDTNVEAKLTIKNATDLTLVSSSDDIELLQAEGIIDFIDPALLLDSAAQDRSVNYYDSLVASLPDFNLNSTVGIEDNAVLRLIIDEQSGDYIETSGGANLELGYDRTGNLQLTGNYTIKNGVYRLSFYDLVKKNFTLAKGSTINWSGSPKNGDLNIKAVHTVESNSIGLIGHEIGENEKSIYKRSLDYQVGINILGTIEKPIISFSLDLPQNEKVNYPVLANKLDRLRQPEYESELNKQVFGLLVLGGFLPESSADVNSSVIATTALSNSVNSLLASQLNRFTSQYVKGVNIDVGIQSFSDYSAPGGKTQTAMDFRVSKSIMNDRLSFEIGGDFDINQDQSGANTGTKNYRGDVAIIYDLTGNGDKQLKLFNNETYDIIYQEIRNTGISLIFIREFENKKKDKSKDE